MDKSIQNFVSLVPLLGVAIYALGFISLSSYLSSVGISYIPALDSKVIQVGFLTFILLIPILLVAYYFLAPLAAKERKLSEKDWWNAYYGAYGYTWLYSFLTSNLLTSYDKTRFWELCFLVVLVVISRFHNKLIHFIKVILIFTTLFALLILNHFYDLAFVKVGIIHQLILFSILIGIAFVNGYLPSTFHFIVSMISFIVISAVFTGNMLLGVIKPQFGGLPSKKGKYYFTKGIDLHSLDSMISNIDYCESSAFLELLYENENDYFFKVINGSILTIAKKDIAFVVNPHKSE